MKPSNSIQHAVKQSINDISLTKEELNALKNTRINALRENGKSHFSFFNTPILTLASLVAVVSVVSLTLLYNPTHRPDIQIQHVDEFTLLSSQDSLELYQNLDFYMWLDVQQDLSIKS